MSRYMPHLAAFRDTDLSPCPRYMAAHGDNAHRPTNKPPIRCLLRLLFFRNEKNFAHNLLCFENLLLPLHRTSPRKRFGPHIQAVLIMSGLPVLL